MNSQQLKDLAEKAGFITFAGPDIHAPEDPYSDGCAAQLAKFAELIVKECSNFLKDTLDDHYHFAAERLEEHFGVEE